MGYAHRRAGVFWSYKPTHKTKPLESQQYSLTCFGWTFLLLPDKFYKKQTNPNVSKILPCTAIQIINCSKNHGTTIFSITKERNTAPRSLSLLSHEREMLSIWILVPHVNSRGNHMHQHVLHIWLSLQIHQQGLHAWSPSGRGAGGIDFNQPNCQSHSQANTICALERDSWLQTATAPLNLGPCLQKARKSGKNILDQLFPQYASFLHAKGLLCKTKRIQIWSRLSSHPQPPFFFLEKL